MIAPILYAILIAIVLTLLLTMGFRNRGPWGSAWSFWLVIFLAIWATSLWIEPTGPVFYGVAWAPLLFVGLLFAILLGAAVPVRSKKLPTEEKEEAARNAQSLGGLFWFFIIIMLIAIGTGYYI